RVRRHAVNRRKQWLTFLFPPVNRRVAVSSPARGAKTVRPLLLVPSRFWLSIACPRSARAAAFGGCPSQATRLSARDRFAGPGREHQRFWLCVLHTIAPVHSQLHRSL